MIVKACDDCKAHNTFAPLLTMTAPVINPYQISNDLVVLSIARDRQQGMEVPQPNIHVCVPCAKKRIEKLLEEMVK